jgi:hypothetical protein
MTLPSVTTSEVTSITSTSAEGGGSVTSDGGASATGGGIVTPDGGATVTGRGVCWGLTKNPEISGSHTDDGSRTGDYVSSMTGLSPDTTYHVRAYATNSAGTGYGDDVSFMTLDLSKYSIPFSESFSRLILPPDWTTQNEGTGIVEKWAISETRFSDGSPNEAIYSWQDVDPGTSRLVTPPIDTTGYSVLNLSFKHVLETFNSGGITIQIQTSPDGSTWRDEAWSVLTASSDTGPETVQTTLTQNLNRATTYVAFVITGNLHYFDVWYIDDVRISATASKTLKAPVLKTPSNGAKRQPTAIKLSWRDKNGSPAEAGHRIRIKPNGGTYTYYTVGQNIQSCKLSRLLTNKKYYWNVLAMGDNDGIADSHWSNSGKDNAFTTKK